MNSSDEADDLKDVQAHDGGDQTHPHEDEDDAGQVKAQHQEPELCQRADAVFADGERHGAEGTQRRHAHDDGDHAEQGGAGLVQHMHNRFAVVPAQARQAQAEQHGEQQHLQDFALRECVEHGVGDDVQQEANNILMRRIGVFGDGPAVQGRRVDVQADAGLEHMCDDQAEEHGERRHNFKVDDCLDADTPDLLRVGQLGDTHHDGDEDDRSDDHSHQLDEGIAEGLHLHPKVRPEMAQRRS
jgi:hypothetical protein